MGFLDRLHKVATGLGGALKAPVGLVADLASAPWRDEDEFDGVVNTLYRRTVKRGGDFFGELVGPEEGVGAVVGAFPTWARTPARAVAQPALRAVETAYREGVAEPLSTALTAASLSESRTYGAGPAAILSGRTWRDAHDIAQTRSPGQALALAFTEDVLNETEVAKFVGTDTYDIVSGIADAATRIFLDPTVIGGKVAKVARTEMLVKPITSATDINKVVRSGRILKFNTALEGKSAAEIRNQFFPDHKHGAVIAAVLAEAGEVSGTSQRRQHGVPDNDKFNRAWDVFVDKGSDIDPADRAFLNERGISEPDRIHEPEYVAEHIDDLLQAADELVEARVASAAEAGAGAAGERVVYFADRGSSRDVKRGWHVMRGTEVRGLLTEPPTRVVGSVDRATAERIAGEQNAATAATAAASRERVLMARRFKTTLQQLKGAIDDSAGDIAPPDASAMRLLALRGMMGDLDAIETLRTERAALAGKLDRLTQDRDELAQFGADTLFSDPVRVEKLTAEIDSLYAVDERLARAEAAMATLTAVPRYSHTGATRSAITRSAVYQQSPLAAPLRSVFNMNEQRMVRLHDQSGDVQLDRMLRKSGMDQARRDALRGEYMAALTPMQRQSVLARAENEAVTAVATRAGMTKKELEKALTEAARGRARVAQVLQSRVYDGEGRSRVRYYDDENGVWTEQHMPLLATQEANYMPLVDMDELTRATTTIGQWRARHPTTDVPEEMLAKFYRVWKPSVLLRVGWPLRVVTDEQLRILAKLGALSHMSELGSASAHTLGQVVRRIPKEERIAPNQRPIRVGNYEMEGAYGAPGDAANIYRELASSGGSFEAVVGQRERKELDRLREATGEQRSLTPDAPDYGAAWERDVNLQLGQDQMARRLLAGETPEQVIRWMRGTPEGQTYARRNPVRRQHIERWVNAVAEQVESYLPTDELKKLALQRKAKADDLVRALPDASARPVIHGEILAQALGKGQLDRALGRIVEAGYKNLGSKPSDVLSRNRYFSQVYKAEVTRLVDVLDSQARAKGRQLTDADINMVERRAREYALGETRNLLYDLAESSELAEMVRFFMPFYSAWAEVLTRWAGLSIENPAFVARARLVAGAPERANLDWFAVTDEEGNVITDDGPQYDTQERYLTIRLPEWVKDMPGGRGLRSQGNVKFGKDAFNMVLQGPPGFGPTVQIPVNEIVKDRPQLEDSLKWVLPFGTTQEVSAMLLPATAKRLRTRAAGEDDRIYTNTLAQIWTTKIVDYKRGLREDKPTYAEAKKETDAFFNMRMVASFVSPAAPTFDSPYQVFINVYRQLRAADPATADEKFLDQFGPEFFPLTASFSRSMDGVPPTLEGYEARKKYQDLIEKYPEMGGLIVGAEGAGDFARSVYDHQLANRLRPGSNKRQREGFAFEEFESQPEVREGWIEYRRVMSTIEAERIQRGLPNLQVKAASDLAAVKRAVVEDLATRYPEWYARFNNVDRDAMTKRLAAMEEITADRRLSGRDDIRGLDEYLDARKAIQAELAKREARTLTAASNQDLALAWESIKGAIIERNLAFQDLYYRYLERDQVAA